MREALKGWGRRLARPQRQAGALAADVLAVIRLTAPKPRARGRGVETPEQAAERGKFDLALVAVLSDGGLRRSEASTLTWGDVQRWDDGSGRITVIRSKTDAEAQGAVVAITFDACGPWTPSSRRVLTLSRKYSGCRSRGSPGGSRRSPKSPAWLTLSIRRMLSLLMTKRGYGLANRSQREITSDLSELLAPLLCVGHDPVDQFPIVIRVVTHG